MVQKSRSYSQDNQSIWNTGFQASYLPRSIFRVTGVSVLFYVITFISGCGITQETKQSLSAYNLAMNEVQQSARLFLEEFSDGLKIQRDLERASSVTKQSRPPDYPDAFNPPEDISVPQTETDKALASSRQALLVVNNYNKALVALAEGHSESEISARAIQLGGTLNTLASVAGASLPGLSQFVGLGSKIIKLAQDARNRVQLKDAVIRAREPVGVILSALEKQTTPMYRLSLMSARQGQDKIMEEIQRAVFPLKLFLARYSPPTVKASKDKMAAFQVELLVIGDRTKTNLIMPNPFAYTKGKPAFDQQSLAEMQVFMQSIRTSDVTNSTIISKQNAYYSMMDKYVAALRRTQTSMDLLKKSLTKPTDMRAEIGRMFKVAFELRGAMTELRNQ